LLAAALAAVALTPSARASLVVALELGALTAQADRVVVAEVTAVRSAWDAGHHRILSTVELHVAETWKGTAPADATLTIVQPGGAVDGIEMIVHGQARFAPGERAVLFLRGPQARGLSVVGLGQGKRPLRFDATAARWMVEGGDRSAAVRIESGGRLQPAGPEPALPLDELRRRVTALVRR
jgi:hypothetical protein